MIKSLHKVLRGLLAPKGIQVIQVPPVRLGQRDREDAGGPVQQVQLGLPDQRGTQVVQVQQAQQVNRVLWGQRGR